MIPLAPEQIIAVFTSLWVLVIVVLWLRHERRRGSNYDWTITKDQLYKCTRCHLTFLARNDSENLTRCPRCNEICFLHRRKHF